MSWSIPSWEKLQGLVCGRPKPLLVFKPTDRLREFLSFCDRLEDHPFVQRHMGGGQFTLKLVELGVGATDGKFNFDDNHLETLLMRIRQFIDKDELFHVKELRKAVVAEFGASPEFQAGYDRILRVMDTKFKGGRMSRPPPSQCGVITGQTYGQLLRNYLYTGRIHSEQRLKAAPGSAGHELVQAPPVVSKELSLILACASMAMVNNIFAFRMLVLLRARDWRGQRDLQFFQELAEFDRRVTGAGAP